MILLVGVAGSGKSTQGQMLADEKGYAWISTGAILRVLVTGTRRQEMLEGKLLRDDEMTNVMDKVFDLIDPNDEFVLDGFPRSVPQMDWLLEQANKGRLSRIVVLHLYADEQTMRKRLMARGRLDDSEEVINRRFEEYQKVTLPIIKECKRLKIQVYDIDASQDAQKIHEEIMNRINN